MAEDGSVVDDVTDSITLGASGGAQIHGTHGARAVNGVATFNVSVLTAGADRRLVASTARFAGTSQSEPFAVVPGPATRLQIDPIMTSIQAGTLIPVVVRVTDAVFNLIPSAAAPVTLITTDPARPAIGTTTVDAVGGVATFTNVSVGRAGTVSLVGTAPGLMDATSNAVSVMAGPASQVTWLTQPSGGQVGTQLNAFTLQVQDAYGNPVFAGVMSGWGTCVGSLQDNPAGASVATLAGGGQFISSGSNVESYRIAIDRAGTGYTLLVTCTQHVIGTVRTSAPSAPFSVTP